jgi:hypothetical protein
MAPRATRPILLHDLHGPELADKYEAAFGATALTEQLIKHDMDEDSVKSIFAPLLEAKLEKAHGRRYGAHRN